MPRIAVFLRAAGGRGWVALSDPSRILTARTPEEVVPCLAAVQRDVDAHGCWAAGFVAYEAAAAFGLPVVDPAPARELPLAWFGIFPATNVGRLGRLESGSSYTTGDWQPSIDERQYLASIDAIKARIAAGDTYQINYTFRLTTAFSGEPLSLFHDLEEGQQGPWAAYVDTGPHAICSASPELFYLLDRTSITCRPMKGTGPRGRWMDEDRRRAQDLRESEKNRAENVMVVDMARNDLGRLARTGTVRVASLFDVERYPNQWQMTSTIIAEPASRELPGVFEALFPSGSVTGAPKRGSMAIIRELECGPRGVYTGAVGCIAPDGQAQFNVAIRTVTVHRARGEAEFGVGSGVVWDSQGRDEFDECLNKAAMLTRRDEPFRLLETIRWSAAVGLVRFERHFARMRESAEFFGFGMPARERLDEEVSRALERQSGDARVRILLARNGDLEVHAEALRPWPEPVRLALATEPVSSSDVFLFHKTTRRLIYDNARRRRLDADSVLLWNEHGEVTEAAEANVVVQIDGRRITPSVECGLLAGVFRADRLRAGEIEEGVVRREDLPRASRIWLINSLRGWISAVMVD